MAKRIDRTWIVYLSLENEQRDRCVDFFIRPDGSHGFEEFRRDPEDNGLWTPVAYFSAAIYSTENVVMNAAYASIHWLSREVSKA